LTDGIETGPGKAVNERRTERGQNGDGSRTDRSAAGSVESEPAATTGWWGENPPYHAPVFVLTHHAREPLTMQGGTTFTFVTDGIETALDQARKAAGDRDVSIAGEPRP
jgi:hypothetical protein